MPEINEMMGMDLQSMPPFIAMGPLEYNPLEIEQQMYMFDRRCVGCVMVIPTRPVDQSAPGTVRLDGKPLENYFFLVMDAGGYTVNMMGIPVRGMVGYGEEHTLAFSGFVTTDGDEIESCELTMHTTEHPVYTPGYEAHDAIAYQAAAEGMVLLKNDGVLPLQKDAVLALFGDGVTNFRNSATGAGKINPRFMRTLRDAIAEASDFVTLPELDAFYRLPVNAMPSDEIFQKAREATDLGILIITRGTGENIDCRPVPGEYYLTPEEEALLERISKEFAHTLVLVNTGYPIDMRWVRTYHVDAVLYTGLAGQSAAEATLAVLDGRVNPSGHLSDSWTWTYMDNPANANFYAGEVIRADDRIWAQTCYEEGIYVGYRYYETFGREVAFPFGWGLSYTTFSQNAVLTKDDGDGFASVKLTVTNTGSRPGKAVAQIYAALPETLQEQPARILAGFAKTGELAPGEAEELLISIPEDHLGTWDELRNAWVLSAGEYVFYAGDNVRDAVKIGAFTAKEKVLSQYEYRIPAPVEFEKISKKSGKTEPEGSLTKTLGEQEEDHLLLTTERLRPLPETLAEAAGAAAIPATETPVTWAQLKEDPALLDAFTAQFTDEQLARFNVMYGHGWSMEGKGEAGRMAPCKELGVPQYVCADGNSGVNLHKANIGMPTSVVVCQTWNRSLAEDVGRVIGEEAAENDIQMILATAMNIHRAPLNGRQPEYFSEDPLLAGLMAASQVRGLHKAGISDSVKHVACNNCETARKRNHSLVPERALREIYLRAFAILIREEKPDTIMTGYNALNGSMCGCDSILMDGIFRQDYGFDGFAMTDWNSYDTVDIVDAANAGISWLTPGENDGSISGKLAEAVREGRVTRPVLLRNARRVFAVMLRRFYGYRG